MTGPPEAEHRPLTCAAAPPSERPPFATHGGPCGGGASPARAVPERPSTYSPRSVWLAGRRHRGGAQPSRGAALLRRPPVPGSSSSTLLELLHRGTKHGRSRVAGLGAGRGPRGRGRAAERPLLTLTGVQSAAVHKTPARGGRGLPVLPGACPSGQAPPPDACPAHLSGAAARWHKAPLLKQRGLGAELSAPGGVP